MRSKFIFILIVPILIGNILSAQESSSNNADLGIYFSYRGGISYIKPIEQNRKFEILATFEHAGLGLALNKLYVIPFVSSEPNLTLVAGFGAFVRYSADPKFVFDTPDWTNRFMGFGINGIIGLDYLLPKIGFHIGVSLRPAAELGYGDYRHYPGTGYMYLYIPFSELKF